MKTGEIHGRFVHVSPQGKSFVDALEVTCDAEVNDVHVYTFPTSMWVDTPNITSFKLFHDGKLVRSKGGLSQGFLNDVSSVGVENMKPVRKGDILKVELTFDDTFDEDEGYVIYLTQNGKTLTPSKEELKTKVPTGPTTLDVVIKVAEVAAKLPIPGISKADAPSDDAAKEAAMMMLGSKAKTEKVALLLEPSEEDSDS